MPNLDFKHYSGKMYYEDLQHSNLKPLKIQQRKQVKLNTHLCIPSHMHAYSMCVEYTKNWFLSRFKDNFFKSIHIEGEHVLYEHMKYDKEKIIKREKPALSIVVQEDHSFNNDMLDSIVTTLNSAVVRSARVSPFFKDQEKDIYLKMPMKLMLVNFTFRMKVNTKAKQLDLKNWLGMAFGGFTEGRDIDMDFHVPNDVLLELAKDAGFVIKDNKIVNTMEFLTYLNSHSMLPFIYKLRCINGNNEFFIRVPNLYVHHRLGTDISIDDGERQGNISSNYTVELEVAIRFPCPQFFMYYSQYVKESISYIESDTGLITYPSVFNIVPIVNNRGWNQYMTTELEEEDLTKPLVIDFKDLFEPGSEMDKVIKHTLDTKISPAIFMDIQLYNDRENVPYTIDWNTLILTTNEKMIHPRTFISIYLDTNYFNEQLNYLNNSYKTRYKESEE